MKNENEAIKEKIIRDIGNLFEHEEEYYDKQVWVGNFWSNNYIEYESNSDRNKTLSVEEYLSKARPYLKDIINDLRKHGAWKIQSMTAINFMSSKYNDKSVLCIQKVII